MDDRDLEAVLASVRDFVRGEVVPREEEIEESDRIPAEVRAKAAAMGLFGYAIPEEHGGLGLTPNEDVRLAMELGRTSLAFRSMFGTKRFITNAPEAGLFVVFARTDPEQRGGKGISVILVDVDTPGVSVGPPDRKMGQSGAHTAEVSFTGARVPAPCRSSAAWGTCAASPSSACTATCGCCASTRGRARSSRSSSPGSCCARRANRRPARDRGPLSPWNPSAQSSDSGGNAT